MFCLEVTLLNTMHSLVQAEVLFCVLHNLFRDILHDTIKYIKANGLERIGDSFFTLIHPKAMHTRQHQIKTGTETPEYRNREFQTF